MNSCIYRGTVRHTRRAPVEHRFELPLFMMYLDLEELPKLFDGYWLWSARRPAPAWLRRADYLGEAGTDLATSVRDVAERLTGARPDGSIRMLTHLRYFGYVQNPVTFYYCSRAGSDVVETVLAEITNTPWGERHTYAAHAKAGESACGRPHRFSKAFHVSPFMGMGHEYEWRFGVPGRRLHVHMRNRVDGEELFDATLAMERVEIGSRALAGVLIRFPWMTVRVVAGIYWEALRLRLKGTPFHEHPGRRAA